MPNELELAPVTGTNPQPVDIDRAELERFWQELYGKVKADLERWEVARMKSEEDARKLVHLRLINQIQLAQRPHTTIKP